MTKIEFYFLSFIILTFLACPTKAQDTTDSLTRSLMQHAITVRDFGRTIPQEKVYLHFDNTSYYQGDKIWFQSYVVSADQNRLSNLSKTLYVELLNPEGIIIDKRSLRIENGRCSGNFELNQIPFHSGFYEIRAYTKYMTNFGEGTIFSRIFPVFDLPQTEGDYSERRMMRMQNINVKSQNRRNWWQVLFRVSLSKQLRHTVRLLRLKVRLSTNKARLSPISR